MEPLDRIEHIKQRLAELKEEDPKYRVDNAWSHCYALRPRLTEEQVAAFESQHHITLPIDYRLFLLHAGDGGAGPHDGILRLGNFAHVQDEEPFSLSEPFPHTSAWRPEEAWSAEEVAQRCDEFDEEVHKNRHVYGSLPLAPLGCGMFTLLIVSGPERGHVWFDNRANNWTLYPLTRGIYTQELPHLLPKGFTWPYAADEEERLDFLTYYELWLYQMIEKASKTWKR